MNKIQVMGFVQRQIALVGAFQVLVVSSLDGVSLLVVVGLELVHQEWASLVVTDPEVVADPKVVQGLVVVDP